MTSDPYLKVVNLNSTPNPQKLIWQAMHQDYSEECVCDETAPANEEIAGGIIVKRLLGGNRGHYGPLEHPSISLNVCGFPHDVMQQARTHRVGISFDVQSGRYTGQRVVDVAERKRNVCEVFYVRPVGEYIDRDGKKYEYTVGKQLQDLATFDGLAQEYARRIKDGFAEEHARGVVPYHIRQHFVVTFSLRAALHFMDLRSKRDAQYEIRTMTELMEPHLRNWVPQVYDWYATNRLGKALLAP